MIDYTELVNVLRCKHDDCEGCDLAFFDKDEGWMCQYAAKDEDAADAIEALQAKYEDERQTNIILTGQVYELNEKLPHWVSVNDPPKFSGKVFVWRDIVGDFYDRELTFDVAYYNGLAGGPIPKGTFFQPIPGTTDYRVLDDVIYWWRPEPPQEVQDDKA